MRRVVMAVMAVMAVIGSAEHSIAQGKRKLTKEVKTLLNLVFELIHVLQMLDFARQTV